MSFLPSFITSPIARARDWVIDTMVTYPGASAISAVASTAAAVYGIRRSGLWARYRSYFLTAGGAAALAGGIYAYKQLRPLFDELMKSKALLDQLQATARDADKAAASQENSPADPVILTRIRALRRALRAADASVLRELKEARAKLNEMLPFDEIRRALPPAAPAGAAPEIAAATTAARARVIDLMKVHGMVRVFAMSYYSVLSYCVQKVEVSVVSRFAAADMATTFSAPAPAPAPAPAADNVPAGESADGAAPVAPAPVTGVKDVTETTRSVLDAASAAYLSSSHAHRVQAVLPALVRASAAALGHDASSAPSPAAAAAAGTVTGCVCAHGKRVRATASVALASAAGKEGAVSTDGCFAAPASDSGVSSGSFNTLTALRARGSGWVSIASTAGSEGGNGAMMGALFPPPVLASHSLLAAAAGAIEQAVFFARTPRRSIPSEATGSAPPCPESGSRDAECQAPLLRALLSVPVKPPTPVAPTGVDGGAGAGAGGLASLPVLFTPETCLRLALALRAAALPAPYPADCGQSLTPFGAVGAAAAEAAAAAAAEEASGAATAAESSAKLAGGEEGESEEDSGICEVCTSSSLATFTAAAAACHVASVGTGAPPRGLAGEMLDAALWGQPDAEDAFILGMESPMPPLGEVNTPVPTTSAISAVSSASASVGAAHPSATGAAPVPVLALPPDTSFASVGLASSGGDEDNGWEWGYSALALPSQASLAPALAARLKKLGGERLLQGYSFDAPTPAAAAEPSSSEEEGGEGPWYPRLVYVTAATAPSVHAAAAAEIAAASAQLAQIEEARQQRAREKALRASTAGSDGNNAAVDAEDARIDADLAAAAAALPPPGAAAVSLPLLAHARARDIAAEVAAVVRSPGFALAVAQAARAAVAALADKVAARGGANVGGCSARALAAAPRAVAAKVVALAPKTSAAADQKQSMLAIIMRAVAAFDPCPASDEAFEAAAASSADPAAPGPFPPAAAAAVTAAADWAATVSSLPALPAPTATPSVAEALASGSPAVAAVCRTVALPFGRHERALGPLPQGMTAATAAAGSGRGAGGGGDALAALLGLGGPGGPGAGMGAGMDGDGGMAALLEAFLASDGGEGADGLDLDALEAALAAAEGPGAPGAGAGAGMGDLEALSRLAGLTGNGAGAGAGAGMGGDLAELQQLAAMLEAHGGAGGGGFPQNGAMHGPPLPPGFPSAGPGSPPPRGTPGFPSADELKEFAALTNAFGLKKSTPKKG